MDYKKKPKLQNDQDTNKENKKAETDKDENEPTQAPLTNLSSGVEYNKEEDEKSKVDNLP